jgi:FlaG/FlaF family flagellin (archaellin)
MTMKKNLEHAVSPVVGVMLMLVVTIIIAAVVSAFAGGLSTGTSKEPQMTISAQFSQSTGMTITHQGGDTVSTKNAYFVVTPSADFGEYQHIHWKVNSSVISVGTSSGFLPWYGTGFTQTATTFQPGENANISAADLYQVQPGTYPDTAASTLIDPSGRSTDGYSPGYGFMYSSALGERFNLQLIDTSGKTIAQTVVTIQP